MRPWRDGDAEQHHPDRHCRSRDRRLIVCLFRPLIPSCVLPASLLFLCKACPQCDRSATLSQ